LHRHPEPIDPAPTPSPAPQRLFRATDFRPSTTGVYLLAAPAGDVPPTEPPEP
jgi:hypothetical protein